MPKPCGGSELGMFQEDKEGHIHFSSLRKPEKWPRMRRVRGKEGPGCASFVNQERSLQFTIGTLGRYQKVLGREVT